MSMEHVNTDASVQADCEVAKQIRDRLQATQNSIDESDRKAKDVRIAARAKLFDIRENRDRFMEEQDQLKTVLNEGSSSPISDSPEPGKDDNSESSNEEEEPDDTGGSTTDTEVQPAVRANPRERQDGFFVMPHSSRQWLLALLGFVVGVILWAITRHLIVSGLSTGAGRDVLGIIWFLALAAAGFFSGGLIGRRSEVQPDRR